MLLQKCERGGFIRARIAKYRMVYGLSDFDGYCARPDIIGKLFHPRSELMSTTWRSP
jgi:hypothetical protein